MSVLRIEDFDGFLKHRLAGSNGLLIHGSDPATIAALARQTSSSVGSIDRGGLGVLRFEMASLKEDPSKLLDEFYALSLLGDRRVILIDGVDDSTLKFLGPVIDENSVANFLILTADSLSKISKLRIACESAALFGSLVIYEEDSAAQAARIRRHLANEGLQWSAHAEQVFYSVVGTERGAVDQEITKLALYCLGQLEITEQDIEAICGDTADFAIDELIDAVLAGDLGAADRMGSSIERDVAVARGVLPQVLLHLSRLQALLIELERGASLDLAVRNAKPVIFFKRHNAFKAQLRKFDLRQLSELQNNISAAILHSRKQADLSDAITSRALLSLARSARN